MLFSRCLVALLIFTAIAPSFSAVPSLGLICPSYTDPPPQGWKLWSQKATWPNGVIPGLSKKNETATIPCNTGIILDVPAIFLDKLIINGWLKVVGSASYAVTANFVIVQGKLTIGTVAKPFPGKIVFTLTNGGYNYTYQRNGASGSVGIKAFAVIGGQLELNGMYGNKRPWTVLAATAKKGDKSITVKGNHTNWPVGATIAIASTDYNYKQAEDVRITSISTANGLTVIGLSKALVYTHWGVPIATGVSGVTLDEAAEVALLNRSIKITGSVEPDPLIGGHLIILNTPGQQKIVGLELVNMGQQGKLGRYPLHFHLCRKVQGSFVRYSSIHGSNQRCYVIHGSFGVTLDQNVAYKTKGHCYFLEDGVESGNVLTYNLGFSTEAPLRVINSTDTNSTQTDNVASTFWISNPNNTLIGNVAAGASDTGYWYQMTPTVLGPSLALEEAKGVFPMYVPLGVFRDNVGHSNARSGFRTFEFGYKPRVNGVRKNGVPLPAVFKNFMGYKNAGNGALIRHSDSIIIEGGIYADNRVGGVEVHDAQNITIRNVLFLGETINYGNPSGCDQPSNNYGNCEPLEGCTLPVNPSKARSLGTGQSWRDVPLVGVMIDQMEYPSEGLTQYPNNVGPPYPVHITNCTFGKFSNRCKVGAAIAGDGFRNWHLFPGGHRSSKLKFLDSFPRFYSAPQELGVTGNYGYRHSGNTSLTRVFWDTDGSLVGKSGGYVVTNTEVILPPTYKTTCTGIASGKYAWACPGTCYRNLKFQLSENRSPEITIRRITNPASLKYLGYYQSTFVNLQAKQLYNISVRSYPLTSKLRLQYADLDGCTEPLDFYLVPLAGYYWKQSSIIAKACRGAAGDPSCSITTTQVCTSAGKPPNLRVKIGGKTWSQLELLLVAGTYPGC